MRHRRRRITGLNWGRHVRDARRACGLTQEDLGRRLGLTGRAIYRWERDRSAPTPRHRCALVQALEAINAHAAATLKAALATATPATATRASAAAKAAVSRHGVAPIGGAGPSAHGSPPAPQAPLTAVASASAPFELAILRMADELDLPARRLRRPLVRLLEQLREANFSLEGAERELERWINNAP